MGLIVNTFEISARELFMELRKQTIEEIKKLDSSQLMTLYEIVMAMKGEKNSGSRRGASFAYLEVRESLKSIKGNLSEDILLARDDRL